MLMDLVFCFSFSWGLGGPLDEESREHFNKYAHELFIKVRPPAR